MKKIWLLLISICFLMNLSSAVDFTRHTYTEKQNGHTASTVFAGSDETYHYYKCNVTNCSKVFEVRHEASTSFVKYDEKYHYYKCNVEQCTELVAKSHNFKGQPYHKRGCVCEKCELFFTNQPELKGKHWQYCSEPECLAINAEYHIGGTHDNKGTCEVCQATYQTHAESLTEQGHNEEYHWSNCSFAGCTYKSYQEHVKGLIQTDDYRHWYKCTVCQTEFASKLHESSTTFNSNESYHWQYCTTCTHPLGMTLHTPDQGNTCEICREKAIPYDDKQVKSFSLNYTSLNANFNDTYTLKVRNLFPQDTVTETFIWSSSNPEVATVDGTGKVTVHETLGTTIISAKAINGVKADCVIYVGDNITLSGVIAPEMIRVGESVALTPTFRNGGIAINDSDYKFDYSVLEWSLEGTSVKLINGFVTALNPSLEEVKITVTLPGKGSKTIRLKVNCRETEHQGGTHENDGKCQLCGEKYQEHKAGSEWQYDEDEHWKICSAEGCSERSNVGVHSGGTHENGGLCSKCKYQYANHGMKDWEDYNDKQHASQCINPDCSKAYYENHLDEDKDSKCDVCGHQMVCYTHTGGTHENGGKCTACGTQYESHGVNGWKYTVAKHWQECNAPSCKGKRLNEAGHTFNSVTKKCVCGYTENGECNHTWGYIMITLTSHRKQCSLCGKTVTEEHSFMNGKCECGLPAPGGCQHEGWETNLLSDAEHHWCECPLCNQKFDVHAHTFSGDVCTYCRYNKNTGNLDLDYELRINIYQSEYYIDKEWIGLESDAPNQQSYKYIPIYIDMDIICQTEITHIEAVSQQQDPGYDYLSGSGGSGNSHMFYIKQVNDNKLEAGLTAAGEASSKYFDDRVRIKIVNVNGQEDYANIRIIKAGEERARFHANILYPIKSGYNPGESGEFTIRARTGYIYGNSSEEELEAFNKLDKMKLGRYILDESGVSIKINHIANDVTGTATAAISSAEVIGIEEKEDENGFPYYDIKVRVNAGVPGSSKVVVRLTAQYQDGNQNIEADFEQTREVTASMRVFNPITYTSVSGGNSGGGSSSGSGNSGGGGSGNSGSSGGGSHTGGVVGGTIAGIGALGLLVLFIFGKKMSGH